MGQPLCGGTWAQAKCRQYTPSEWRIVSHPHRHRVDLFLPPLTLEPLQLLYVRRVAVGKQLDSDRVTGAGRQHRGLRLTSFPRVDQNVGSFLAMRALAFPLLLAVPAA